VLLRTAYQALELKPHQLIELLIEVLAEEHGHPASSGITTKIDLVGFMEQLLDSQREDDAGGGSDGE